VLVFGDKESLVSSVPEESVTRDVRDVHLRAFSVRRPFSDLVIKLVLQIIARRLLQFGHLDPRLLGPLNLLANIRVLGAVIMLGIYPGLGDAADRLPSVSLGKNLGRVLVQTAPDGFKLDFITMF
jgi:hypothetical protein